MNLIKLLTLLLSTLLFYTEVKAHPPCDSTQAVWEQITVIEASQDDDISAEGILADGRLSKLEHLFLHCIKPLFTPAMLSELGENELHKVMLTMQKILFYNKHAAPEELYLELVRKIPDSNKSKQHYITYLLEHHLLKANVSELEQLEQEFSIRVEKPEIKNLNNKHNANLIRANPDGSLLFIYKDTSKGANILFIGSSQCAFSRNMANWLIGQKTPTDIIWITKQVSRLDTRLLNEYRENSGIAYDVVYNSTLWPQIRYWGTPTVYFMLDGKVMYQVVGWPDTGREEEFNIGLGKIGLAQTVYNQ